jgi:hypothetical protein
MVRRSSLDTALACSGSSSSRVLARSSCGGLGDPGGGCAGANNLLLAQKWSVEGAPCDDPNLAKTLDSTCFCQIWFASKVGVGLSTFFFLSLSLSLYTPSTRLVFSFMVLAGPLLHEFSSPLSTTHIISSPLFHDLSDARTQW